MSDTLRISDRAARDIEGALAYTLDQFGARKQSIYRALIRDALTDIAADPDRAPAKRRPELHPDARTFHIARRGRPARHFFLYRLLHDSMDLQRHLPHGFEAPK
jgi:plasmid stabilization system protein ParE